MPTIQLTTSTTVLNNQNMQVGSSIGYTVTTQAGTNSNASVTRTNTRVNLSTTSVSTNSGSLTLTGASAGGYQVNILQQIQVKGGSYINYRGQINGTITSAPTPSYSLGSISNMNEGASQTVSVTTQNVSNGTTLYWVIAGSGDFTAHSGSFTISSNAGSFTISSIADQTTEGTETKTLYLRTGSTSGTTQDQQTFSLLDTSTASGGSGSGGTGTGGSTTGTAAYGVAVYGVNGSSVVFGSNLRTQNSVFSTTLSAVSGTTYGPYSVANANDTNKIQILVDYSVPTGSGNNTVSGSQMIITKSSTGFTFRHTAGGTKTFVITAIKIA